MPSTETPPATAVEEPQKAETEKAVSTVKECGNIKVAYEAVELSGEDVKILDQIQADPSSPKGHPRRRPRKMVEGKR